MASADFRATIKQHCCRLSLDFGTWRGPPEVSAYAFAAHPPNLQPWTLMDRDFAILGPLVRP